MSSVRVQKEYNNFQKNPPRNCFCGLVEGDLFHWEVGLTGPENTPYAGGVFLLDINLKNGYPYRCPKISFITKIYHPNISEKGEICLNILQG
jgi:ubiquitin-conjugating enzyme E2 D/E